MGHGRETRGAEPGPSPAIFGGGRLPVVAIVGRPNAGKSTLFNRLVRRRKAVVDETAGVTRDFNFAPAKWRDTPFLLVDTGGIETGQAAGLLALVQEQTRLAVAEADAVIFLLDGLAGLSPADTEAAHLARRAAKPVFFAVNKIDGAKQEALASEFFALGVERLFAISSAHGRGIGELMDEVSAALPARPVELPWAGALRVALVGRPNAGKSSLLNRLVGFQRSLVHAEPGTTRDALDTILEWEGKPLVLVDTAGIRRRSRVSARLDQACTLGALKALEMADLGVLIIDATAGMTDQDARIARFAWERNRGLVLAVNKWDAVPPEQKNPARCAAALREKFPAVASIPVLFISALTGEGVRALVPAVHEVARAHAATLSTPELNRVVREAARHHGPPVYRGRQPKFFYAAQVATRPPTVAIFTSAPDHVHPSYEKYLENRLRDAFKLRGTPIRLRFRERH